MYNQDWVCAICLEDHSSELCTIRPCGHVFHSQCINMDFKILLKLVCFVEQLLMLLIILITWRYHMNHQMMELY